MKKYIGWTIFFLVIVGLAIGGYFVVANLDTETFQFKEVEILDYNDFTLHDFVEQDIVCNRNECKYRDKNIEYTLTEIKNLGKQDITLEIKYEGETFKKTFHVDVVDRKSPEIILSDQALILKTNDTLDAASYITSVTDNYDTLNIDDIEIENNVDLTTPGDYEIIYSIKDTSGNIGTSTLKVKVKDSKVKTSESKIEPTTTTTPKPEVEKQKLSWNYKISGLFTDSGSLNQDTKTSSIEKTIEVGWDTTLKLTSITSADASIRYVISTKKITSEPIITLNGSPYVKTSQTNANSPSTFEYTFTEEGTYYLLVTINSNGLKLEKEFILHLTVPDEVVDMRITKKDYGSYIELGVEYIGGSKPLYFVVLLQDTNDPNFENAFNEEDETVKLYYTKGYYYNLLGALVDEDGNIVMTKTLTIET